MLWSVITIAVLVYLGLIALLFFYQSRLVYFPGRTIEATPETIGLPYEAVAFQASDGVKLSGWFIPAARARGVLLFFHGNAGNVSHCLDLYGIFHRLGLSTLAIDYRGFGQSEGTPTERGTYLDARAAWDFLVNERGVPPSEIVVFGHSLGASVAAWLAKEVTPKAAILQAACTSARDLGAELYPFLPVRLVCRFGYNTRDYARQAKCPVLVIHSRDDELVPFRHGRRVFEAASEPKAFLEITGGHNDGFLACSRLYMEGLDAFLSQHR